MAMEYVTQAIFRTTERNPHFFHEPIHRIIIIIKHKIWYSSFLWPFITYGAKIYAVLRSATRYGRSEKEIITLSLLLLYFFCDLGRAKKTLWPVFFSIQSDRFRRKDNDIPIFLVRTRGSCRFCCGSHATITEI